jgi:putative transposase
MRFYNFPKIIKHYLAHLPKDDYPVLDTFTFGSCWLGFSFDQSLDTMRSLFFRLNSRDISLVQHGGNKVPILWETGAK